MTATRSTPLGGQEGKYLTFALGALEFGLALARVREIVALPPITPLPLAPAYVRGVMNLRGRVIPVVDLRCKFGMTPTEDDERKCVIVCDVERGGRQSQMSILVDSVSEVAFIGADEIDDAPTLDAGVDTTFISGIAKADGRVQILLDIAVVLAGAPSALS